MQFRSLVSIPERVLGWLKLDVPSDDEDDLAVSIPERVLGWLKHGAWALLNKDFVFQSLKGFWVG